MAKMAPCTRCVVVFVALLFHVEAFSRPTLAQFRVVRIYGEGPREKLSVEAALREDASGAPEFEPIERRVETLDVQEGQKLGLEVPGNISRSQAVIILNAVTVLWGTQHAVIKLAVDVSCFALYP